MLPKGRSQQICPQRASVSPQHMAGAQVYQPGSDVLLSWWVTLPIIDLACLPCSAAKINKKMGLQGAQTGQQGLVTTSSGDIGGCLVSCQEGELHPHTHKGAAGTLLPPSPWPRKGTDCLCTCLWDQGRMDGGQ